MGLTVNYTIESSCKSHDRVIDYLEKARQMAMDLAFEEVGPMYVCDAPPADFHEAPEEHRWLHLQAERSIPISWTSFKRKSGDISPRMWVTARPTWLAGFTAWPGHGCESIEIVLAEYPKEIEFAYKPEDDGRFWSTDSDGWFKFDWFKWKKYAERKGLPVWSCHHEELRKIKVPFRRFSCSACCKTQYASEYGMANFVRCHLSVCHLLRKMETIPTFKVKIDDEGHYEESTYSDDYREAYDEGRQPTYVWHPATYSIPTLIEECGAYNEMMAAVFGGLKDALAGSGLNIEAPIKNFKDFEHLEAKGQTGAAEKFIKALADVARPEVEKVLAEEG